MAGSVVFEKGLVSIILCFYNEERYLEKAIDSVLAQTYEKFELILVSDGSKDNSCKIADRYEDPRIKRVYLKDNQGLPSARNAGYDVAVGEFIAHFDGDDILLPDKLEVQVKYLNEHPETVVVSGGYYTMDAEGRISRKPILPRYTEDIDIRAAELYSSIIANAGASMFRHSLITEHGVKNDSSILWCEDYHLWHQIIPYGKIENLKRPFFYYRVAYGSITQQNKKTKENLYNEMLFKTLKYGWSRRGFDLSDGEIWLILIYLFKKSKRIHLKDNLDLIRLYEKIELQVKELNLEEGRRILDFFKIKKRENNIFCRYLKKLIGRIR